jgi:hypothetical protein
MRDLEQLFRSLNFKLEAHFSGKLLLCLSREHIEWCITFFIYTFSFQNDQCTILAKHYFACLPAAYCFKENVLICLVVSEVNYDPFETTSIY